MNQEVVSIDYILERLIGAIFGYGRSLLLAYAHLQCIRRIEKRPAGHSTAPPMEFCIQKLMKSLHTEKVTGGRHQRIKIQ